MSTVQFSISATVQFSVSTYTPPRILGEFIINQPELLLLIEKNMRICHRFARLYVSGLSHPITARALTARGTIGRFLANRLKKHIFAPAERGRAQAFPLSVFLGPTILYERKNYLI